MSHSASLGLGQFVFMVLCGTLTMAATSNFWAVLAVCFGLGFFGFTIDMGVERIITAIKNKE